MKVAHVCLSCFYIDGRSYQENELVRQHVADGHETLVIASTETHSPSGEICYTEAGDYIGDEGARVIRLPYLALFPHKLATKLRMHPGVKRLLRDFAPDAILFHGLCGWELLTVAAYARENPTVRFFADSHEDWNNSARGFISREILHKLYYRYIIERARSAIRKVLCVSTETMSFVQDVYGLAGDELEFFPLGGHPISDPQYLKRRERQRSDLEIDDSHVLFVQCGKQTQKKRLIDSLRAFQSTPDPAFRFVIAGSLSGDIQEEAEQLIAQDSRVLYSGWKSVEELTSLLCAADIYLQPGTQSATMQHSLCCRCAIILDDVPAHQIYHVDNGWLTNEKSSLSDILHTVSSNKQLILGMQNASYSFSKENLDYTHLAQRIFT